MRSRLKRAKGEWTPGRRALQAAVARRDKPWRYSTGPRTDAGKARCAMNAMRHGGRSRAHILEMRRIRRVLRMCEQNIRILRAFIRARDGLERFPPKWLPVRRRKRDKFKNLERASDFMKSDRALVPQAQDHS